MRMDLRGGKLVINGKDLEEGEGGGERMGE